MKFQLIFMDGATMEMHIFFFAHSFYLRIIAMTKHLRVIPCIVLHSNNDSETLAMLMESERTLNSSLKMFCHSYSGGFRIYKISVMTKEILTTDEKMVVMTLFNLAIDQAMVFCKDHEPDFFKDQMLQSSITNDLEDRVKIMNIFDFIEKFQNVICPSKENVELLHEASQKLIKLNNLNEVSTGEFSVNRS